MRDVQEQPAAPVLTASELERYSRQIRIDGFGEEGQRRLRTASVVVSRVGGVGGTIAMLLARAGVGRLVIAHGGHILPEHLNRMTLASAGDVGRPCTEVFSERLRAINPDVQVTAVASNIQEDNVASILEQGDLVADAAPLFEERYLMNREAVRQAKPLVMGAMYSTEGYVTTIVPSSTPCLACIYPQKPDYWNDIGVFPAIGPGPMIVGAMAAMEVIKLITGFGRTLSGCLWFFDLETNRVRLLHVSRRANCRVCGTGA